MKAGNGLTRQQRRSQSRLATAMSEQAAARRKKKNTPEPPSVRKRDSSGSSSSTARGGAARQPSEHTMPVEQHRYDGRDAFHQMWMRNWGDSIGSMEQKTSIPSMRFVDCYIPPKTPVHTSETLQVFSVRISPGDTSGLHLPLRVYGVVAARDNVDLKRNVIFERGRDDCQIITEEAPYLVLTGPTRAVVLVDPVYFEVDLKLKGNGQSEDQDLIFLTDTFRDPPRLLKCTYTGKISTLEMTLGHISSSAEATISMKVIHGSWPGGFRGSFVAKTASIDGVEFALLLTGDDGKLPVADDDDMIRLQRQVVCAEINTEGEHLEVSVVADGVAGERYDDALLFTPQKFGRLSGVLNVGSCEIEVTVAWSRVSSGCTSASR